MDYDNIDAQEGGELPIMGKEVPGKTGFTEFSCPECKRYFYYDRYFISVTTKCKDCGRYIDWDREEGVI
jgi:uncharacterized protein (DUF983 family)